MARLIPDSAFGNPEMTPGEKRALRTLHQYLDDDIVLWYEPKSDVTRRPDIIAYLPSIGLLIYEIKDWAINQIQKANNDTWEIKLGSKVESRTNPFKSARSYYFRLAETFKKLRVFIVSDGQYRGELRFPIGAAVIFPNISRPQFIDMSLDAIIGPEFILFQDDLQNIGNERISGKALINKLKNHFDPWWFNDELNEQEMEMLRAVLYPEITSSQKDKGTSEKIIILDEAQEQIAKRIGSGHKIIRGIAGSGKSLVLCSKAKLIAREHPKWKILLTCYNISLASQLKHYIKSFNFIKGPNANGDMLQNIDIMNFHSFCSKIFDETETKWPSIVKDISGHPTFANLNDYEKTVKKDEINSERVGIALQNVAYTNDVSQYDAILIDESQDFHASWLKALLLFLNGKTNFLLLAEDPNQKIYPRTFTYRDTGINVVGGGKIHNLLIGYRSTYEIVVPASKFVVSSKWDEFYKKYVEEESMFGGNIKSENRGKYPEVYSCKNFNEVCKFISLKISEKVKDGYSFSDIGVLYLTQFEKIELPDPSFERSLSLEINYPKDLIDQFVSDGVPYFWLSQNRQSKHSYDPFSDKVTISTLFSAKGLEFGIVFMIGMELFPWKLRKPRENASLIYVGMTRARSELYMLSIGENEYMQKLRGIIYECQQGIIN